MATRVESIAVTVAAEMVARGVDVQHQWGKQKEERHDRLPRVLWVEPDTEETIEPPSATIYDSADGTTGSREAVYDRAVKLLVKVLAKTKEESEVVMDVLLAAGRQRFTESAWGPSKIKKAGERPSSGAHVRALDVVVRLPVFDVIHGKGHITSVAIVNTVVTDGVPDPAIDPDLDPGLT